jgi:hypothetical protein
MRNTKIGGSERAASLRRFAAPDKAKLPENEWARR